MSDEAIFIICTAAVICILIIMWGLVLIFA